MKISTKGRYGLRLMLDLVVSSAQGKVTLQKIAQRQGISEKYLWQIANRLKAAGLITAIPGAKGGYRLTKTPAAITLADILEALEGELSLAPCLTPSSVCSRSDFCVSKEVWKEITEKIMEAMKSMTLSDMIKKQSRMMRHAPLMYAI